MDRARGDRAFPCAAPRVQHAAPGRGAHRGGGARRARPALPPGASRLVRRDALSHGRAARRNRSRSAAPRARRRRGGALRRGEPRLPLDRCGRRRGAAPASAARDRLDAHGSVADRGGGRRGPAGLRGGGPGGHAGHDRAACSRVGCCCPRIHRISTDLQALDGREALEEFPGAQAGPVRRSSGVHCPRDLGQTASSPARARWVAAGGTASRSRSSRASGSGDALCAVAASQPAT